MARTELGMRSEEFWSLSWYEWNGYMGQIALSYQKREQDQEFELTIWRNYMAYVASMFTGKIHSSDDFLQRKKNVQEDIITETPDEFFERMQGRFERRNKKAS